MVVFIAIFVLKKVFKMFENFSLLEMSRMTLIIFNFFLGKLGKNTTIRFV